MTESGMAKLQKTDIFRRLMWFSYNNENDWHTISCERVKEIQELNEKGIKVFNLQVDKSTDIEDLAAKSTRELELLDKKFAIEPNRKKKTKGNKNTDSGNRTQEPKLASPQKSQNPLQKNEGSDESRSGKNSQKRKNKNRNKPHNPQSDQPQSPKAENTNQHQNQPKAKRENIENQKQTPPQSNADGEEKPQAKRQFPPRKNQGPNPNSSENE
jgi:hypothetical protein